MLTEISHYPAELMNSRDKMAFLELIFLSPPAEWNIKIHNL